MDVEILISTISSNLHKVPSVLLKHREDVKYIVSVQNIDNESFLIPSKLKNREDVKVILCDKRGLSENRNNCIREATADICFIADDDVRYENAYIDEVKNRFFDDNSLDILSGKIQTYDKEPEYKKYKNNITKVNFSNFKNISSIEIVFRRESIVDNDILFDPDFGLGSLKFSKGGEETIFIKDSLNKGLKINYFPIYLVKHPYESSGKKEISIEDKFFFLGGYTRRIFGRKGFIFILYFCFKYFKQINSYKKIKKSFNFFFKGFNN